LVKIKKMKIKIKIIFLITFISLYLNNCGTVKKAFDPERKNSSEEFLVEKKSPLSMPPDFNELPKPKAKNIDDQETVKSLENLIITNENNNKQNNQNLDTDKDLEKSILDKIIKN
tara:strand:- start:54 stop:398 length:345 start_codon:yes stop_codon:yes gene_type:complete